MAHHSPRPQPSPDLNRGRTERRTDGQEDTPRLPAERDESARTLSTAERGTRAGAGTGGRSDGAPAPDDLLRADIRRAHDDLAQGQQDTDRHADAAAALMPRLRDGDHGADGGNDGGNDGANDANDANDADHAKVAASEPSAAGNHPSAHPPAAMPAAERRDHSKRAAERAGNPDQANPNQPGRGRR